MIVHPSTLCNVDINILQALQRKQTVLTIAVLHMALPWQVHLSQQCDM